jgi:Zn-dependent protease with chaperone function
VGTFGFRPEKGWVIVTQGALDRLNRAELSSLIARELTLWKQGEAASLTWLARIFEYAGYLGGAATRSMFALASAAANRCGCSYARSCLSAQPLCPALCFAAIRANRHLDTDTVALCGSRRSLAEALRKVDAYSERTVSESAHCSLAPPLSQSAQ